MWIFNKFFKQLSLNIKVILPVFLVVQFAIALVAWILIGVISKNLHNEYLSKGLSLVTGLAYNVQDSILNRDDSWLQGFVDDYKNIQGVGHVYVVTKQKKVSAHSFVPEFPTELINEDFFSNKYETKVESSIISVHGKKRLNITAPILAGTLGHAVVGMDLDLVDQEINQTMQRIILYAIIVSILSSLIVFLVLYRPIQNIRYLSKFSQEVASGSQNLPILDFFSQDELGVLAQNFSKMLEELQFQKKNLEERVKERTATLNAANEAIKTMIDSLDQGFLVFDKTGTVLPGVSKATIKFLKQDPVGKPFHSIFPIHGNDQNKIKKWQELIFDIQPEDFEDTLCFVPDQMDIDKLFLELNFKPILDKATTHKFEKVVCVISDKTEEHSLSIKTRKESALVKILMSVLQDRESFGDFVQETRELLSNFNSEIVKDFPSISFLLRTVHTIKGNCSVFYLSEIVDIAHNIENLLADNTKENFIDTEKSKVNSEFNHMYRSFEKFLSDNEDTIGQFWKKVGRFYNISEFAIKKTLKNISDEYGKDSQIYKNFIENIVFEDLGKFFKKYESQVIDLAEKQKKSVEFKIDYGKVKILARPYLTLISSFIHAFRNIIDHGIELPQERRELGKRATGTIHVNFEKIITPQNISGTNFESYLRIEIHDDGAGIDLSKVKEKAIQKNLITETEAKTLMQQDVIELIFSRGFSTKDEVSEISGRGFGLDIIKYEAQQIGGKVWMESTKGVGTTLIVEVPILENFT